MKRAAGAALLASALGIGILAASLQGSEPSPSPWKEFRVLLVEAAIPEGEVLASLGREGLDRVLAESTQPVLVSNWAGQETMSLAAARASLAPGDPRLDPYLQRLGLWFEARSGGNAYRVYYLEGRLVGGSLARALAPFGGRYILPDEEDPAPRRGRDAFSIAMALSLMLASASLGPLLGKTAPSLRSLSSRRPGGMTLDRLALRLSLLLPWAAFAFSGGSQAALASLWALAFAELADKLDLPLDEFRGGGRLGAALRSLRLQGLPPLALPACAVLALVLAPGSIGAAALVSLGSLLAVAGYALASASRTTRRHFIPLPLGRSGLRRPASAAGKARGALACAVVLAWGISALLAPSALLRPPSGADYPLPVAIRGGSMPLISEARSRFGSESGSALPGIASYLEHRAFQEALPFVPIGEGRADPFAPASLPLPDGRSRTLSFDDAWARAAYASLPPLSVEGMLLAQGSATVGRVGGASSAALGAGAAVRSGRPLAPIGCLLYIFLLVPPLARVFGGIPLARGALSGELRQEA
jgi:hypothetical protein